MSYYCMAPGCEHSKSWNITFISSMYKCPSCMKTFHGKCLNNEGRGVIRRGFCPYCGTEIHLTDRIETYEQTIVSLPDARWASGMSCKKIYQFEDFIVGVNLGNVREGPSIRYSIITQFKKGQEVEATECYANNWVYVESRDWFDDRAGYMSSTLMYADEWRVNFKNWINSD